MLGYKTMISIQNNNSRRIDSQSNGMIKPRESQSLQPPLLSACLALQALISNAEGHAPIQQITAIIDTLLESHPNAHAHLSAFLLLYGDGSQRSQRQSNPEEDIMRYWIQLSSFQQNSPFHFKQCLFAGLIVVRTQGELPKSSALRNSKRIIQYNNAICYFKLGRFTESRNLLEQLMPIEHHFFAKEFERLQVSLNLKLFHSSHNPQEQVQLTCRGDEACSDFQRIVSMGKAKLCTFLEKNDFGTAKMHAFNWYNLALACKLHRMPQAAICILQKLASLPVADTIKKRSLLILSELYDAIGSYERSINTLLAYQKMEHSSQVEEKIEGIKKKMKSSFNVMQDLSQPKLAKMKNTYSLLTSQNINELTIRKLGAHRKFEAIASIERTLAWKNKKNRTQILHKEGKEISALFSGRSKGHRGQNGRTVKLVQLDNRKEGKSLAYSNRSSNLAQPRQSQASKRGKRVRFSSSSSSDQSSEESLSGFRERSQEKITTLLYSEQYQEAMDEIKNAEKRLEELEALSKEQALRFTIRLAKWCRQAGSERYCTLLLKRALSRYSSEEEKSLRIQLLKELSICYQELREYKQAGESCQELVRLGELEQLDKLGELFILRENYGEALKCYERLHESKGDIYSLVKLAHVYSKIPSFGKKAVEVLSEVLFENKTLCIFKEFPAGQEQEYQNALLLLVTVYMNLNGTRKAKVICDKYLKEHFSAYPIAYILGVLRLQEGENDAAFDCFLSALRIRPNHLPSLVELLHYLQPRGAEVLSLLRKAFRTHHRDWPLLKLFLHAATHKPPPYTDISLHALISAAQMLESVEDSNNFRDQIESVWLWASEMVEERQRKMSIAELECVQTVYIRLGELALARSSFEESERYFTRILQKIRMEGSRIRARPKVYYSRLEIDILRRLSYLHSQQRQWETAIEFLQDSISVAKQQSFREEELRDRLRIAQLLYSEGNHRDCLQKISSTALNPEPSELLAAQLEIWIDFQLLAGSCLEASQEWRLARARYQSILKVQPHPEAAARLASIYRLHGQHFLAAQLLREAKVAPNS